MEKREIKMKLNHIITNCEVYRPNYILISINGIYFYVNKIEYDDIHCRLYLDNTLIGGAFFANIDSLEIL